MGFWRDEDGKLSDTAGDIIATLFVLGVICGVVFGIPAITGFYKLEPNYGAIEVSRITGTVSEPIIHIENGGIRNIHWRYWYFTRLEKSDVKIHIVDIECFGEQREGSLNIFNNDGLDYEQWPNNIIIGYRLKPENLDQYYITITRRQVSSYSLEVSGRPVLENLIKASVFSLLTKGELNQNELQFALNKNTGGQSIAEITSVDYTTKITS